MFLISVVSKEYTKGYICEVQLRNSVHYQQILRITYSTYLGSNLSGVKLNKVSNPYYYSCLNFKFSQIYSVLSTFKNADMIQFVVPFEISESRPRISQLNDIVRNVKS